MGWQVYESVLVIEHAVGLDPKFPGAFDAAVRKLHAHQLELKRSSTTQINQTKEKFESSPSSE